MVFTEEEKKALEDSPEKLWNFRQKLEAQMNVSMNTIGLIHRTY